MVEHELEVSSILFDMDGVITNTMPDHYFAWKTILQRQGIQVTYHDIYLREGQPGIESVPQIFHRSGRVLNKKKADEILREKEDLFKKIVKTRFVAGARSFVKMLRKSKFELALVTGTSRHELYQILPESLYSAFSVIITGNDVCNGKPHPEPYLKSIKQLGIKPSLGVVIENAPFGIQSAKRAGLKCFAIETSLPREYLQEADAVFSSIKELKDKVSFYLSL